MRDERLICAGFGGQGIMSLGQLLAYGGMLQGLHVTWLPSYGPEMRGGTAYCNVMLSDMPIGSPVIAGDAICAIIMNQPSLVKFESAVASGGILLLNSSMADSDPKRTDITVYSVPAAQIANDCGEERAANMVMLGCYLGLVPLISLANIEASFDKVFGEKAELMLAGNMRAIGHGIQFIQERSKIKKAIVHS